MRKGPDMPGKNQEYGKDYKAISFLVSPEEHHALKVKAAQYGVTFADVCRLALANEGLWRKAHKEKARPKTSESA